ncbi:Sister chromatid cohesion protein pds5 [Cyphellophora attinorum]|uniref:Sister chromatid cohesion protein pds5 n=1 Tax=Cyphellophora attinorum TaxID=1664694 RepID=A0A0N0NN96_9EURO|nr:Sister chromatid cohesion protein pds5 [Phialophora attinorum]KPI41268.1 Sister chromatid cohesion protein pds5 [Phialophora attinorum]
MAKGLRAKPARQSQDASTEKAYDIPGLDFEQPLTWRPGKAIPIADLLDRLKDLREKLAAFDDDQPDSRLWTGLAGDLVNANLLGHKDRGIRAYAVTCILDVLKICAPDAPFQNHQLKDIFNVVINYILPALSDPTNAYNSQHVYVLQSLSESQSILLLADVDNPESLTSALFTNSFDIFAEPSSGRDVEISKTVEYHLKNLLGLVIDEIDVPHEVTDIIISQFMRVAARKQPESAVKSRKSEVNDMSQSKLQLKEYPVAYNIAKSICTTCLDKMTAQITHYFNAVIVDAGTATNNSDPSKVKRLYGNDAGDEDDGLADLRKAHRLLRELWRACPDVIANVIPQVEAELQADSVALRRLATETLGDIAAGIGIAGFVLSASIDPAAYPQISIDQAEPASTQLNPLLTPASPKPFAAVHRIPYQNFMGRRNDRSPIVREAWVEAASRVLSTRAGGIGLGDDEQAELLAGYAQALRDPDEHVRLAAIRALSKFSYHGAITILAADGGLAKSSSVFSALAERIPDRKIGIWGAASYDIQRGNEAVQIAAGDFASRIFNAYYIKDEHLHAQLERVLFEALVPLNFPSSKGSQTGKRKSKANETNTLDGPDEVRALRILTLVRSLDERSRRVLLGMQGRQSQISRGVRVFLEACESYNGGVVQDEDGEAKIRAKLSACIDSLCKPFYDAPRTSADLWKFAKQHDRRNYQLIKFAVSPEHDYKTMSNGVKELFKRIREGSTSTQSIVPSLQELIFRSAVMMYNRSHVPAIMDVARTDQFGLGATAHEVLREISSKTPEVLKSHVTALCAELEQTAPSATNFEESSAADTLKACSQYARKYPQEVSKDRKFLTALSNFALYSQSPRAAKHAVTILLTVSDRKEMHARDILTKILKDCRPGSPNFLSRLAAIGQICRYAPDIANAEADAIGHLVLADILSKNRKSSKSDAAGEWTDHPDEETQAKEISLKILVNQCRGEGIEASEDFVAVAETNYKTLFELIENDGEISTAKDTPPGQRNRLRLAAARMILKLCTSNRQFEALTTPTRFHALAWIVIHPPNDVRTSFVSQVRKYYAQNRLSTRWLTIMFLLAFEPDDELRSSALNFLKSRTQAFERKQQDNKSGSDAT